MMYFKALLMYLLKVNMCFKRNPSALSKKSHGSKKMHLRNVSTRVFKVALGFLSVVPVAGKVLLQHSN